LFEDHWTIYHGKYSNRNNAIAIKVKENLDFLDNKTTNSEYLGETPPWLRALNKTDVTFSREVNQHESLITCMDLTSHRH